MRKKQKDTIKSTSEIKKKRFLFKKKSLSEEGKHIIEEIERIKDQLEKTRVNFDLATDDSLIDCYIYEIISLNKKYQYFLKKAKEIGLVAKGFEKISS